MKYLLLQKKKKSTGVSFFLSNYVALPFFYHFMSASNHALKAVWLRLLYARNST